MSTGITFDVDSRRHLCSLNVSNDCLGYITIEESYFDGVTAWDFCIPCAEHEERLIQWHEKHPRCETCGQFLKKRVVVETPLSLRLTREEQSQWISHYVQDYWGEWDHI